MVDLATQDFNNVMGQTGIRDTCIGNALRGWSKTAGGFMWKFVQQ